MRVRIWFCLVAVFTVLIGWTVKAAPAEPGISSLSAVVYEPTSGLVLYEKDSHTPRPMASTTKLMTALLAAEHLSKDMVITAPAAAFPVEGSNIGLKPGDNATVQAVLAGLLLESGNDAANVLALSMSDSIPDFAVMMNRRATELGMKDSTFVTPSGLDQGGHSASAMDMALLGAAVLQKPLLAELCASKSKTVTVSDRTLTLSNHNRLLSLYGGTIGMKTGFTKKSGRCLVSAAQKNGITLVIASLNGGDYWNDHMHLYDYAFSLISAETMPVAAPETYPVAGGVIDMAHLYTDELPVCVVRTGENITAAVELPPFLWAPVEAGTVVGTVRYSAGGRELERVPIRVAENVEAREVPGVWAVFWRHFVQYIKALLK